MRALLFFSFLGLLAACGHSSSPRSATRPAGPLPTTAAPAKAGAAVMILGVYHFDNPGQDLVKSELDDHLSAKRQAEIEQVVASLAAFKPTRILVEAVSQEKLDARFRADRPLEATELDQLGIRLARRLGLPGLVAIDHRIDMDFDRLMAAAQASKDQVFLDTFQAVMAEVQADLARQRERTVSANLRSMNDPANIARGREIYLQMARVKHGDDFAGPDVLAAWYQRNFRIFANLAAAVTSPVDRILVIYGGGHTAILRDLVAASPNLVLVEPNDYLGGSTHGGSLTIAPWLLARSVGVAVACRPMSPHPPAELAKWREQIEWSKEMFDRARVECKLRDIDRHVKRADLRLNNAWVEVFAIHLRALTYFFVLDRPPKPTDLHWSDFLSDAARESAWRNSQLGGPPNGRASQPHGVGKLIDWKDTVGRYVAHPSKLRSVTQEFDTDELGGYVDGLWKEFNRLGPDGGEFVTEGEFFERFGSELGRIRDSHTRWTNIVKSRVNLLDLRSGRSWTGNRRELLEAVAKRPDGADDLWGHLP